MKRLALMGGTGSGVLVPAVAVEQHIPAGRWGEPSAAPLHWQQGAYEVFYLPRHGTKASVPPHLVNYRANIQAFRDLSVDALIGINAVGGITPAASVGRIVLPVQLIDYTWGRAHTFFEATGEPVRHVDFDPPFDERLRGALVRTARSAAIDIVDGGCYGATQGPRLETAAEIDRLAADGCDIVGMTAMPEAALAREAGLPYVICAVVVNRAAGRLPAGISIHADLAGHLDTGMTSVRRLIDAFLAAD